MERVYIITKDVCKLTGRKERSAQELLRNLRIALNKNKKQVITKKELADYLGIDPDTIELD